MFKSPLSPLKIILAVFATSNILYAQDPTLTTTIGPVAWAEQYVVGKLNHDEVEQLMKVTNNEYITSHAAVSLITATQDFVLSVTLGQYEIFDDLLGDVHASVGYFKEAREELTAACDYIENFGSDFIKEAAAKLDNELSWTVNKTIAQVENITQETLKVIGAVKQMSGWFNDITAKYTNGGETIVWPEGEKLDYRRFLQSVLIPTVEVWYLMPVTLAAAGATLIAMSGSTRCNAVSAYHDELYKILLELEQTPIVI